MCDYQGYEFGAGSYPDSVCIDGRLHDADNCDGKGNIYLQDEEIPCPMCLREDAVKWYTARADNGERPYAQRRAAARRLVADIRRNRRNGTEPWKTVPHESVDR